VVRTRVTLCLAFAGFLAAAVAFGSFEKSYTNVGDVWLFAKAGSTLLSTHWAHTFDRASVQAGPLELVLASIARTVGGGHVGFAIVLDLACSSALATAAMSLLGRRPAGLAIFGIGACLLALPGEGYNGHPAELLIAVLWLLAAREARSDHVTVAGGLIGLSAGFEVWGILGVTVLALAPNLRRGMSGLVLAAAIPAALFAPFVAGGDFHMFDYRWVTAAGPARLFFGDGHPFTWGMRLVEGATIVGIGCTTARLVRRLPESIWIVPAVTVIIKIGLDPVIYAYYWDTALVMLLLGATHLILYRRQLAERLGDRIRDGRVTAPIIGDID
jgi:hypothetical protein